MTSSAGKPSVTISGYGELLSLHKTIMEAKFHPNPENRDVLGSPHVAGIANAVMHAIIDHEVSAGRAKKAQGWRDWRQLKNQSWVGDRIIEQVQRNPNWMRLSADQKDHYLSAAVAPMTATPSEVETLRRRGDGGPP